MRVLLFSLAIFLSFINLACAAFDSATSSSEKNLSILRIIPEGLDVPGGKQIVIQFNRPVVAIGRMDRDKAEIPITIEPALDCHWHWLNTSALACNLDEKNALRSATKYSITVNPGIKTLDGVTLTEVYKSQFTTQRPDVVYARSYKWLSPGTPVIQVTFNQAVTKDSVLKHIYFESDNKKRLSIKADPDPDFRELPEEMPVPGTKVAVAIDHTSQKIDDDARKVNGVEARRIWLIQPQSEIPSDKAFTLNTEPGLISALGAEPGVGQRIIQTLHSFPEFKFLGVKCFPMTDEEAAVLIEPGKPETQKLCNPLRGAALVFSSPLFRSTLKANIVISTVGKDETIWSDDDKYSMSSNGYESGQTYDYWIPTSLKAATEHKITSRELQLSYWQKLVRKVKSFFARQPDTNIVDEFGRPLQDAINLSFKTDHRKPNFEIGRDAGILEKQISSDVPLYVNNLKKVTFHYRKLTQDGRKEVLTFSQDIPKAEDIQFAIPMKIREMLEGKSGVVYGTLTTEPEVKKSDSEHDLLAEVTPYQVQVKLGHFSSLVWVTDLATGLPVADAKVIVYLDRINELSPPHNILAHSQTNAMGIAYLPGSEKLDPDLTVSNDWKDNAMRLFIRVDKDKDMAVLPLTYTFQVQSYRMLSGFYQDTRAANGHMTAWGTTAQGVYRAGDTIQYKIYVRNQNNNTLTSPPKTGYNLKISDPTGNVVEELKNITLNDFGTFSGEYSVPKTAPVGWYNFTLGLSGKEQQNWAPMRVLVSDFTVSPFKVSNQLHGDLFRAEQDVEIFTAAKLHSGGAYNDANVRVTAVVQPDEFKAKSPELEEFNFASVLENNVNDTQVYQKVARLDAKGENTQTFKLPKMNIYYGKLNVESAVQDDRGKYLAAQTSASYAGVNRLVGLRLQDWMAKVGEPKTIEYVVVDDVGNPAAGTKVNISIELQQNKAVRVKGAGSAFLTEFSEEFKQVSSCNGESTLAPLGCVFNPKDPGYYRITAKIADTNGATHSTQIFLYVIGKGYVLWNEDNDYSLQMSPEKKEYKVGDTARFLVKNPYPDAMALITVERYGVIDSFTQKLEGSTPIIEIKVKPDYIPGFFLSVTVFSPRADKPVEKGVDLGKPTFRMGYAPVIVKDTYKEMVISARTDKEVYKPRERATVTLHAEPRTKDKQEPIEYAVAVLDEAVFDMIQGGKSYYDPYTGFYKLHGLDVINYSLITRLVGVQNFAAKGALQGGDGGADLRIRDIFKFVSYWNPSIRADDTGNAKFEFEVPDNLTGWRVLVIAVTPTDRLGLGEAKFKVNQPTEIRPLMPNQVTEGDSFKAGFSVMNRTDKPRELTVKITASGDLDGSKSQPTYTQTVKLDAYKRATVLMPIVIKNIEASRDIEAGSINFVVTAGDKLDSDGLTQTLKVNKRRSLDVAANYGTTTENSISEPIEFPKDIHNDVGNISVIAAPSVIGNIEGAFKYLRDYPYTCWEQILTKGVMASHYNNLRDYLATDLHWRESTKLPETTLKMAASFQAPGGGMSFYLPQDQYADPYLSAYTALSFNWLRASGYKIPQDVETKLHKYLENLLRNNAYPEFYNAGMAATVRAVALAVLADHQKITLSDLERYRPHLPQMSLFGKTHFMQAAMRIEGGKTMAQEAAKMILAASNQSGGKFTFSETLDDSYSRILSSPLRENCAILSAFSQFGERPEGKDMVGDIPFKLVRMITQSRGSRDYWQNTQENMFCMNALIDYSRIYESTKPNMQVAVAMDNKALGQTKFSNLKDKPATFMRNIMQADPGRKTKVDISRTGAGRLYYATRLSYAQLEDKATSTNAGIEVHREYSVERNNKWELLKSPADIKQGELVRVDLYVSLAAARNFVVVDDPVPGGLEPVNRDLANTSIIDANKGAFAAAGGSWWFKFNDWVSYNFSRWSFYHMELRHDAVRFYSDYLPAGNYHLSYAAQAIAPGSFTAMPTKAEEMYDPDVYGKDVPVMLKVDEAVK